MEAESVQERQSTHNYHDPQWALEIRLTSSPHLIHVGSAVFPPDESSLHILIEVLLCRLNQSTIVRIVIPNAVILGHGRLGAANDDTSIHMWNQIVVKARASPQGVGVVQIRRLGWIGSHNTAAEPSTRHDLLRVFRKKAGREAVRGENDFLGFDNSSRSGDGGAPIGVRS